MLKVVNLLYMKFEAVTLVIQYNIKYMYIFKFFDI